MSLLSLFAVMASGQQQFNLKLWPNGVPEENGLTESEGGGNYFNVTDPELHVYLPEKDKATGQAVVICPGGSYMGLAFQHEGVQVAQWFNQQGIAAIILKYRMPNGHYEIPRKDVQKAIETVKENASKWGYDRARVGVIGFSAGGHLASTAATHFTSERNRPAFAILVYPVISMHEEYTHQQSRESLIGKAYNPALIAEFSNEERVTKDTPPTFIAFSDDDSGVDPRNGTLFYNALQAHGVPGEIHIYPTGEHGWGWLETFKYKDELRTSLARWLKDLP